MRFLQRLSTLKPMRRLRVEFQPEAVAELRAIFESVRDIAGSVRVAQGFTQRIKTRCDRLGDSPLGGRPRDDLAKGLRTVAFERSVIIAYRVTAERVEITNIFYGWRNYAALLNKHQPSEMDD